MGRFIVFDGPDGTGKTTLAKAIVDEMTGTIRTASVQFSAEPTVGPFGQEIRRSSKEGRYDPLVETALFLADRIAHVQNVIKPALENPSSILVLDRYYFSTCAYQGARGLDPHWLAELCESFCPIPPVVFFVFADDAAGRIERRGDVTDLFERGDYQRRVTNMFNVVADRFIEKHLESHVYRLNTSQMDIPTAVSAVKTSLSKYSPFFDLVWAEE